MAAASVDEGYDDEQFECSVPQNLHCAICLNVLKQPMQCVRNEHSFCKPCIHRHLQGTQRCPTCIEPLTLRTLRPSRVISGFLSELMIKCDNFARGCQETMKLELLPAHVAANCEYSPVKCSNRGCEVIMNRRDQHDHEINQCEFRLVQCRVCGEQVNYHRRELHCYVTRKEMDEVKQSLKENKDEMSSMKEIMMNLSRELTRHMGDAKKQMGEMKKQMGEMKKQISDIKFDVGALRNEVGGTGEVGQAVAHVEKKVNAKEDIIVAGGGPLLRPTNYSVEMFSWTTRQWTLLPAMTSARCLSSSFVHRGHMYVCGGWMSDSMEVLQLGQDGACWRNFPVKLPHEIYGHTCVVYEDSLFIFGGVSDGKVTNDIYKISLVAPYSSQVVGHMPEPRAFHGAQCFGDKVFIAGGTTGNSGGGSLNTVLVCDITKNCCKTLAPLPFAVCSMATVIWKDNIIILGGQDENGNVLNAVVKYNVTNQKSKMLPAMKHKRQKCSAVITGNMIVVMGGFNWEETFLKSAECFNLDLYTWERLPSMNELSDGATAVVKCI